jgi:branched-chain amino acid transport system substrate-binding protein
MRRNGFFLPLLLALALVGAACAGSEGGEGGREGGEPILIGFPADLSSTYSYYDVPMRDGAQFAIDEINAAGGVLGRPLELRVVDQRNDVTETTKATQRLINEGVVYLIGTTGDAAVAQGTLACQSGIPVSTGDGTAPTLVGDMGDCAFQLVMSDNVQGAVVAEYAIQQGYETAYLLGSPDYPYTANLPEYFRQAFERGGGRVVGEDSYVIGAGDFSAVVTKVQNADPQPDVIFTPMFPPDTQVFMRQLRQAGVETPVLSTDGNFDESLKEAGAQAIDGMVFTASGCPPEPDTPLQDFYDRYREATGEDPVSIVVALGYDEIYALKSVIEQAGSAEPADIIQGLAKLDYEGVTGRIKMDPETRRAEKPAWLIVVKGTEFTCGGSSYPSFVPPVIG